MKAMVLLLAGLLAGCAFQRAEIASRAKSQMVGMSKKELLLCAGAPSRSERVDDLEVLTYSHEGDRVVSLIGNHAIGHARNCEVSFALLNGVVQRVDYRGRTGSLLTQGEQCAFVVEGCVH